MLGRVHRGAIRCGATRDAAARTSHDRGKIRSGPSSWAWGIGKGGKQRGLPYGVTPGMHTRRRTGENWGRKNWGHGPPHSASDNSLFIRLCQDLSFGFYSPPPYARAPRLRFLRAIAAPATPPGNLSGRLANSSLSWFQRLFSRLLAGNPPMLSVCRPGSRNGEFRHEAFSFGFTEVRVGSPYPDSRCPCPDNRSRKQSRLCGTGSAKRAAHVLLL